MSRVQRGRFYVAVVAAAASVLLTGCGSTRTATVTVTSAVPASTQAVTVSAPSPPAATTTSTPAGAPSYPIVHFTITNNTTRPAGIWPFTANLVSITENPDGFPGSDPVPPQDTYLMVQVAITSGITGRMVGVAPELTIACHGPNDHGWSYQGNDGYDEGSETAPESQGANVAFGDGQPHLWDAQWQVPEGTSTTNVKCVLEGVINYPLDSGHISGSGRLN
jgi:hypothetical protein